MGLCRNINAQQRITRRKYKERTFRLSDRTFFFFQDDVKEIKKEKNTGEKDKITIKNSDKVLSISISC